MILKAEYYTIFTALVSVDHGVETVSVGSDNEAEAGLCRRKGQNPNLALFLMTRNSGRAVYLNRKHGLEWSCHCSRRRSKGYIGKYSYGVDVTWPVVMQCSSVFSRRIASYCWQS